MYSRVKKPKEDYYFELHNNIRKAEREGFPFIGLDHAITSLSTLYMIQ